MLDARQVLCCDAGHTSEAEPGFSRKPHIQNNPAAGRFAFGVMDGPDGCLPFARTFDVSGARDLVQVERPASPTRWPGAET